MVCTNLSLRMTNEILTKKHNNFWACPCCGKAMKISFNFLGNKITVEPIHAFKCELCGEENFTKIHIAHIKYDVYDPTKYTMMLCPACHNKMDNNSQFSNKHPRSYPEGYKKPVLKFDKSILS